MPQTREQLRSIRVANIKRFESLVATTLDNVERTNLMKLLAAEYAALDQLARRLVRTRARLAKRLA